MTILSSQKNHLIEKNELDINNIIKLNEYQLHKISKEPNIM